MDWTHQRLKLRQNTAPTVAYPSPITQEFHHLLWLPLIWPGSAKQELDSGLREHLHWNLQRQQYSLVFVKESCSDHGYFCLEGPCLCIQTLLQTEHFHAPLPPPSLISWTHFYSSLVELVQLVRLQIHVHLPLYILENTERAVRRAEKTRNCQR